MGRAAVGAQIRALEARLGVRLGHVPGRGVAEAAIGFLGRVGLRKPT
ncbi:hypothetical protein [uncultured Jannaschia sp.]